MRSLQLPIYYKSHPTPQSITMHLLASLSLLAACASAFTVPKGQPDGVYSVTYNPDGTENHTFLSPPVAAITTASDVPGLLSLHSSVKARQVPNVQNVDRKSVV